ncbi:hypothetical protein [Streptomyces anulatus]|uniref:hypothetical protein n=1 Tax=Streptomyces anulatus TaxID=1892 RepID=UPI002E800E05|nr:hypothetical protein [Streptomyces anulatus]WUC91876.1 hypothetical protein OHQ35_37700 [Streptomyces anulatus]
MPLPETLAALLGQVNEQVSVLSDREPLVALRAANILQQHTRMSQQNAARTIERDRISPAAVGTALGCTPSQAKDQLRTYR